MKLLKLVLLPTLAFSGKIKPTCDTPPADLGQGTWTCPAGSQWNAGDTCTISGDGCSGRVKCKRGQWIGKTNSFCPTNCQGAPQDPNYGATWSCSTSHHSSCQLQVETDFKCSNTVRCNTIDGEWTGKVMCRSTAARPVPPPERPAGSYSCRSNGKCKYVCEDGLTDAGRALFDRRTGQFVYEKTWYFCCPAPRCDNGEVIHVSSYPSAQLTYCPMCTTCNAGYELDGYKSCLKKSCDKSFIKQENWGVNIFGTLGLNAGNDPNNNLMVERDVDELSEACKNDTRCIGFLSWNNRGLLIWGIDDTQGPPNSADIYLDKHLVEHYNVEDSEGGWVSMCYNEDCESDGLLNGC